MKKIALIAFITMSCASYGIEVTSAQYQMILGSVIGGNPIAKHCYVVDNNDSIVGAYSKKYLQKLRSDNSLIREAVELDLAVIIQPGTQFCTTENSDSSDGVMQIELIQPSVTVWVAN